MLVATLLLWVNVFFAGLAIAAADANAGEQQQQQVVSADASSSSSSFETDCAKCSFCCTPYTYCAYFDQTATFTCEPRSDHAEAAAAYQKLVEEAKQYMITAPPGPHPTIAPRAVVNTRKPPHRNGTSGAVSRGEGLGGFWGAAVVVGALVATAGFGL